LWLFCVVFFRQITRRVARFFSFFSLRDRLGRKERLLWNKLKCYFSFLSFFFRILWDCMEDASGFGWGNVSAYTCAYVEEKFKMVFRSR
jgi:hypothetical protein